MKRILISTTLIALTAAFSANAADMSYPVGNMHESTPVEYGSGWYIRGDIGYNFFAKQETTAEYNAMVDDSVNSIYEDAVSLRAGFGYQINPNFRIEMDLENTLETSFGSVNRIGYSGSLDLDRIIGGALVADSIFFDAHGNVTGTTSGVAFGGTVGPIVGAQTITASYGSQNIMLNGYYDMARVGKFTPYVGAGLGLSRITYSEERVNEDCVSDLYTCGGNVSSEEVNFTETVWKPAYSVSVGTAYALNDQLSLDVGYSFLSVNGGQKIEYSNGAAIDPDGFNTHQLRAGLRYQIW